MVTIQVLNIEYMNIRILIEIESLGMARARALFCNIVTFTHYGSYHCPHVLQRDGYWPNKEHSTVHDLDVGVHWERVKAERS